jgi:uncharacterized protein DUF4376
MPSTFDVTPADLDLLVRLVNARNPPPPVRSRQPRFRYDAALKLEVSDDVAPTVAAILADANWRTAAQNGALQELAVSACSKAQAAGITVNGVAVATDAASQARLAGLAHHALSNPAVLFTWKAAPGAFVTLTAAQVTGLQAAVTMHLQACAKTEAELSARIAAGQVTTAAEIDAAFAAIGPGRS